MKIKGVKKNFKVIFSRASVAYTIVILASMIAGKIVDYRMAYCLAHKAAKHGDVAKLENECEFLRGLTRYGDYNVKLMLCALAILFVLVTIYRLIEIARNRRKVQEAHAAVKKRVAKATHR